MSLLSFSRLRIRRLRPVSASDREVSAAAELLDVVRPRWYREVDVTTLNLVDVNRCVLGQLWGSYHDGERQLERYLVRRDRDLRVLRAFNGDASNERWRAEIDRRRRVAADLPVPS